MGFKGTKDLEKEKVTQETTNYIGNCTLKYLKNKYNGAARQSRLLIMWCTGAKPIGLCAFLCLSLLQTPRVCIGENKFDILEHREKYSATEWALLFSSQAIQSFKVFLSTRWFKKTDDTDAGELSKRQHGLHRSWLQSSCSDCIQIYLTP